VSGGVRDPRAAGLVRRYHERFEGSPELPVPVEAIAEDLLGLNVGELEELEVSGMLLPDERQVWLNAREARESPGRRRFTLAHEVGHWVCQVLEGRVAPVFCRAEEVGVGEGRALEREANVFAAELLMPQERVRMRFDGSMSGRPSTLAFRRKRWAGGSTTSAAWKRNRCKSNALTPSLPWRCSVPLVVSTLVDVGLYRVAGMPPGLLTAIWI
jgi:IrrE N-terminal-like domain